MHMWQKQNRNSQRRRFFRLSMAVLAGFFGTMRGATAEEKGIRILWLGSSSTYFHEMPTQVAEWLSHYGGKSSAGSELVGKSGTAVYKYLKPDFKAEYGLKKGQSVLDKIREGHYDFVVLQVPTDYLAGRGENDRDEFLSGLSTYCRAIRESGARPIFYEQGWGEDELFEAGDRLLFETAIRNDVPVAPCRTSWKRVRKEHPMLELHDLPDRTHPGMFGTYLNMCCFYAALTGRSPVGLPAREAKYWPFVQENGIRKRDRDGAFVTLNDDQAVYLQSVAWESWKAYQRRLREAQR